jgi:L-asparaginase/Glu-tRNA(Gln) amidotransferase subunit D
MEKIKILHLQTWGTITGNVPEYQEIEKLAHIFMDYVDIWKYIVYSLQAPCDYSTKKICDKDSREILDVDRQRMVAEIEKAYWEWIRHFLITHGTYTMPDTGKYLDENLPIGIKNSISVIITWAMYPWSILWSDAPMNLGASVWGLLNAEKPLWITICMHGKNWDIYKVEKDVENLVFHD